MAPAWIGFAGGVIAAVVSAFVALRQSRMDERLARLNHELDAGVNRRAAMLDLDLRAEEVLTRYASAGRRSPRRRSNAAEGTATLTTRRLTTCAPSASPVAR